MAKNNNHSSGNIDKSLEQWLWDAACSIRGAKDAPKYKDFILPLVFAKRLCDVFDDEINRIAKEVGGRAKAFKLVNRDNKLVRFYIPLEPDNVEDSVWSVIRKLADNIGQQLTTYLIEIAQSNPHLKGIIDRVDVLPDGTLEIIDYKTGANIPKQKEVDRNLQLSFYSLAASSLKEAPFGISPEKIKLSLYFFDTQEKISTTRTKEDLKKAVREIFEVREAMEKSDFTCSKHILCGNCEYKLFCISDL